MPEAHLAKHAAFDARGVNGRPGEVRAGHRAARVNRPSHSDAPAERRVLLRCDLVAGLQRALVCDDHAANLLWTEPAVRNPSRGDCLNPVLSRTVARARPRSRSAAKASPAPS